MNSPNAGGGFSGVPSVPSVPGGRGKGLNRGPGRPGTRKTSRVHRSPSQNGNKESNAPNRSPLSRPNKRPEESRTRFGGEPQAPGAPGNQQPKKSRVNKKIAKVVRKTTRGKKTGAAKKNAKKSVKRTTAVNKKTTNKRVLRGKKGHAGK